MLAININNIALYKKVLGDREISFILNQEKNFDILKKSTTVANANNQTGFFHSFNLICKSPKINNVVKKNNARKILHPLLLLNVRDISNLIRSKKISNLMKSKCF